MIKPHITVGVVRAESYGSQRASKGHAGDPQDEFVISMDPDAATQLQQTLTGRGGTIAFLSTGIFPHPDLKDRIVGWVDLVEGRPEPYDDCGMGTHIAGLAAGDGRMSGGKYLGAAPEARLVGIKVLDGKGGGTSHALLEGIHWAVDHKDELGINVLSLPRVKAPGVDQAVEEAVQAGLVVVTCSGSSGQESPAPTAVTVGADTCGLKPDVYAPGWIVSEK